MSKRLLSQAPCKIENKIDRSIIEIGGNRGLVSLQNLSGAPQSTSNLIMQQAAHQNIRALYGTSGASREDTDRQIEVTKAKLAVAPPSGTAITGAAKHWSVETKAKPLQAAVILLKVKFERAYHQSRENDAEAAHEDLISAEWRLRQAQSRRN